MGLSLDPVYHRGTSLVSLPDKDGAFDQTFLLMRTTCPIRSPHCLLYIYILLSEVEQNTSSASELSSIGVYLLLVGLELGPLPYKIFPRTMYH